MKLLNVPAYSVEESERFPDKYILVSIGEVDGRAPAIDHLEKNGTPVLRLRFGDTHPGNGGPSPMEITHARNILGFVSKHAEGGAETCVIHCHAGVSRSAGVVLALSVLYGWDLPKGFWLVSEPNSHVVGTMLRAFKESAEPEELGFEIESISESLKWRTQEKSDGICLECGEGMKFNVPRLGAEGGFVHADSGAFECGRSNGKA